MLKNLYIFFKSTFIFIILMTFFYASFTIYFSNKSYNNDQTRQYAAIIDAGSSGSRLFLYTWSKPTTDNDNLLNIRPLLNSKGEPISTKITPGLSSYITNPQEVTAYVKPLFDLASLSIPQPQHQQTPIYLLATAGMRIISKSSQLMILENIRKFAKKNYNFIFADDHAAVISGRDEGIYGWLTTNYLLGRLGNGTVGPSNGVDGTVAMMDMGGGSMQMAYEIQGSVSDKTDDQGSEVGRRNKLFVTTFLGYGANSARTRFERVLVMNTLTHIHGNGTFPSFVNNATLPSNLVIEDPCLHSGLDIRSSVRIINDPLGGLNLSAKDHKRLPRVMVTFRGTGAYETCKTQISVLLDKKPCLSTADRSMQCVMAGRLQPRMDLASTELYGFSELWYSTNDVLGLGGSYDYDRVHSMALDHCNRTWTDVVRGKEQGKYPRADWSRLKDQCFKVAWVTVVLHDGLDIPTTYGKLRTVMNINGAEVQWTLGALLYKSQFVPLQSINDNEEVVTLRRRAATADN